MNITNKDYTKEDEDLYNQAITTSKNARSLPKDEVIAKMRHINGLDLEQPSQPSYKETAKMGFNREPISPSMSDIPHKIVHFLSENGLEMLGAAAFGPGILATGAGAGVGSVAQSILSKGPENTNIDDAKNAALTGVTYAANEGLNLSVSKFFKRLPDKLKLKSINNVEDLIGVTSKETHFGKRPGKGLLDNGINGKTYAELGVKTQDRLNYLDSLKNVLLKKKANTGKTVDISEFVKPIDNAIKELQKDPLQNKSEITKLLNARSDFSGQKGIDSERLLNTIFEGGDLSKLEVQPLNESFKKTPLMSAYDLKKRIGHQVIWKPSNDSEKLINKALKESYSKIDGKLDSIKGLKELNEHLANLIGAKHAITRMIDNGADKKSMSPMMEITGGLAGGILTGKPLEGAALGAGIAGLQTLKDSVPVNMGIYKGESVLSDKLKELSENKIVKILAKTGKGFTRTQIQPAIINQKINGSEDKSGQ